MARIVQTFWINPLNGSHILPTLPGDILNAVIAYWEDELNEWRPKRPRSADAKQEKQRKVDHAIERLDRYRGERDAVVRGEKISPTSLQLATDDLRSVMKVEQ